MEQEVEEEVINEWNEDYNEQKDDANFQNLMPSLFAICHILSDNSFCIKIAF